MSIIAYIIIITIIIIMNIINKNIAMRPLLVAVRWMIVVVASPLLVSLDISRPLPRVPSYCH